MATIANTDAIILAGGRGTRLNSVVSDRPKVLADVLGRPLLSHLLDSLEKKGLNRVILSVGYMAEMVRQVIGPSHGSLEILYSVETEPLGTGGGIRLACQQAQSDNILVLNGDSFCGFDAPALFAFHTAKDALGTIAVIQVPDAGRYGRVQLSADGQIEKFLEKSTTGSGSINAGIYLLQTSAIKDLHIGVPLSMERDIFPTFIGRGFYGFAVPGPFIDIGLPETYAHAAEFFSRI
ncbi:MAG: nucleotidyltransferase family protein [bacterium]